MRWPGGRPGAFCFCGVRLPARVSLFFDKKEKIARWGRKFTPNAQNTKTPQAALSFLDDGRVKLGGTVTQVAAGAGRPPPPPSSQPAPLVEADVELGPVIGRGASSVVHAGRLRTDGTPVAVKRVCVVGGGGGRARQVANDLRALAGSSGGSATTTQHPPGLVRLLGAYAEAGAASHRLALVLEHMDGGSLGDALAARAEAASKAHGSPLPPPIPERALAALARDTVRGLAHLHGVMRTLHRDIKPANILLSRGRAAAGGGGPPPPSHSPFTHARAALADFGIAAAVGAGEDGASLAAAHTFTGTVTYMAPERLLAGGVGVGSGSVGGGGGPTATGYSGPADVWALGLTLLEAAVGTYPYDASAGPLALMMQVVSDPPPCLARMAAGRFYSPACASFLDACLAKDPAARPRARELASHPWILVAGEEPLDVDALYGSDSGGGGGEAATVVVEAAPPPGPPPPPSALHATAAALVSALYAGRALPSAAARAARLAPLYAPTAAFSGGGLPGCPGGAPPAVGARATLAALAAAADAAAALGVPPLSPRTVDVTVLPRDTGALVLVTGATPGPAPGPLGRAAGGDGGSAGGRRWAETLHCAPCASDGGRLRIVGQWFRWLDEGVSV